MTLPWLVGPTRQLHNAAAAGRLPSALLVHEAPGVGGIQLARTFAQLVLCTATPRGCGQCRSCQRVLQAEHPDLVLVQPDPELKSGQISVDQVRELAGRLVLSSHAGQGSCVVLTPADAMNRAACNALLKTLEEPRPGAHLLLLTTQPSRLPATIRSRCQTLRIAAPDRATALAWLDTQRPGMRGDWEAALDVLGLAPLEAQELDPALLRRIRDDTMQLLGEALTGRLDVVRVADRWARDELPLRLRALESALSARVLAAGERGSANATTRTDHPLSDGFAALNIAAALRQLDDVRELQRLLGTPVNRPLALERQLWRLGTAALAG